MNSTNEHKKTKMNSHEVSPRFLGFCLLSGEKVIYSPLPSLFKISEIFIPSEFQESSEISMLPQRILSSSPNLYKGAQIAFEGKLGSAQLSSTDSLSNLILGITFSSNKMAFIFCFHYNPMVLVLFSKQCLPFPTAVCVCILVHWIYISI